MLFLPMEGGPRGNDGRREVGPCIYRGTRSLCLVGCLLVRKLRPGTGGVEDDRGGTWDERSVTPSKYGDT